MGQSRISYHVGKLKEAGLVREERRGKWSFYALDRDTARETPLVNYWPTPKSSRQRSKSRVG
jgi:DNA-binding transcriptional ArsR family regulator